MNRTTLLTITENGEVELETEDQAVIHKARTAFGDGEARSFDYVTPREELTVHGKVTEIFHDGIFRFLVLPD